MRGKKAEFRPPFQGCLAVGRIPRALPWAGVGSPRWGWGREAPSPGVRRLSRIASCALRAPGQRRHACRCRATRKGTAAGTAAATTARAAATTDRFLRAVRARTTQARLSLPGHQKRHRRWDSGGYHCACGGYLLHSNARHGGPAPGIVIEPRNQIARGIRHFPHRAEMIAGVVICRSDAVSQLYCTESVAFSALKSGSTSGRPSGLREKFQPRFFGVEAAVFNATCRCFFLAAKEGASCSASRITNPKVTRWRAAHQRKSCKPATWLK